MSKIEIYQSNNGQTNIDVTFDNDTIWLTQKQMSLLFGRNRVAITQHIGNVFREKELDAGAVCKDFLLTGDDGKSYNTKCYNLDVIISIGYRVKSKEGTQFRIWATQKLKEILLQGYSINKKRLDELSQTIELIKVSSENDNINLSETKGLLEILNNYTQSFILLNQYDSNNLIDSGLNDSIVYEINYEEAILAINKLRQHLIVKKEATNLFGNQKDESFKGILGNILQSFDNQYLYPTIEEQAAHLLYFTVKNHPFTDGNKRIGAFMFVWFINKNKHQFKKNGELKINDNALVAITLLVAQSNPIEKDILINLIINLIK